MATILVAGAMGFIASGRLRFWRCHGRLGAGLAAAVETADFSQRCVLVIFFPISIRSSFGVELNLTCYCGGGLAQFGVYYDFIRALCHVCARFRHNRRNPYSRMTEIRRP